MAPTQRHIIDLIIACLALILVAPLLVVAMLAITLTSPGPALFWQVRVGHGQRLFHLYKLRTMTVDPHRTFRQSHVGDPDVTPVGRLLRRFKIDELPQLINVIRGDMALIGPRPYLPCVCATLPRAALPRWDVRPGLTGWAQVNGNIFLSDTARWQMDVDYVQGRTWLLDLRIVFKTMGVVVCGEQCLVRIKAD